MRTRIFPGIVSLAMILCMGLGVAEARRAPSVMPQLSFSGTTVECSAEIWGAGKSIEATLELWEGRTLLDSWSGSGSSVLMLEGSHRAASGRTYTVEVYGTVGGESFEGIPVTATCP